MSDEITPTTESPEPSARPGATFLGFFDKYAPAEELYEAFCRAIFESKESAAIEDRSAEAE